MNVNLLCYGIMAPISLVSQLILIYGYLRIRKMRKHPEIMIFWQCISQSVTDLHWITGYSELHNSLSPYGCKVLGAFFAYCYFLSWDYILFLSIEILIKLKDPLNCNYTTRILFYHLFSHISSLIIFIVLSAVSNNNGSSVINTCFVQQRSVYELLILVPALIHFPICLFVCCYTLWMSRYIKHSNYAAYHVYIVAAFCISWLPGSLAHGLQYRGFDLENIVWLDDVRVN